MTDPRVTVEECNRFAATDLAFAVAMGIEVEELRWGSAKLRWRYSGAYTRPPNFVSGPVMMAIADAALYFAIFTMVGIEPVALTNELKTNFLRPAQGRDLIAVASIAKLGRRIAFGTVEVTEDGAPDRLIAHATGSYARQQ